MRILNKLVSVVLCLVLLSNIAITALAEEPTNNAKDLITYRVPVISNEYTDKTVLFYEYQGKYYLDIEDIKNFTRSTISETDSKIIITHGIRELEIDKSTGHLIDSTVYDQGNIPFLAYEGKYLCEGIPMLMYLGAACTIRDEVALEVLMPSITIWESIMPDYLDYYFNITELYGGEDNVKISLICDILSDVLDGVSGHGLFADGDTHLEDALFEILEVDMMKYASVQEAVATKNQDINDFLSSDAVGTLLEGGSNTTDTVSEVLDYYADFYLETEILKNNIRWQHSYNIGDIDSASKLSKQINSQVYEQSSIKANLGTYENLADVLDLGMIAFDTAVTSYGLMQYDNDTKSLFARTINDEMFNYVGYNEISWTNVSNRISNKLSSNEAIVASTAVENLTEYVARELAEGGTVQALSAFTSKANIYVAAAQIATFVSSLINRDLHEAYSADMNAIWLSAVQYDIARLTTQVLLKAGEEEKFSNVESIEKLKDMLTLYYRTTIAFSENIAVSIDEFGNKNKDEWVKYFSSTTDASVANYAAQYLYRITNCTIVPIVKYAGLTDDVLTSDCLDRFKNETNNDSDKDRQSLISKYGLVSQEQFVSCLGSEIQTYPSGIYGIISMIDLDINNDKTNELFVLRVSQTDNNEEAQIIAEVYQPNGSEPYLCTSQTVYNISFCTASNIYLFYSDILSKYCIMVDSYSSGSYTGVNSWSAKVYTITNNSIDEYGNWESVPFVGISADFESEFKKINVPYAKYCTTYDNRNNTPYYLPLCEVEHEIFGDSSTYMTRNHKLEIKSTSSQENTTTEDVSEVIWKDIPDNFTFTSGAGGWSTEIAIGDDGTFTGEYHDSDMGDTGSQYPNGVVYICNFRGKFSAPEQINNYIYTMKLENLTIEKTPGEVYYENGIKYICSDPYGFDNADEFLIYLPGCPLEETSEEFLSWSFINTQIRDTIPTGIYGIYNIGGMTGFMGKDENSLWEKTYAYSYNSYRSELQPSYYSESHLNFWPESGAATLVLGFDWSDDSQTEFIASDYRGTGEYSISLDFNEDFSSVKVTLKSLSGFNLEPWGGSANGTLSVEYKMK